RGVCLASEPGYGSKAHRPYLVDWGVVALPGLGGLRLSQDTTDLAKVPFGVKMPGRHYEGVNNARDLGAHAVWIHAIRLGRSFAWASSHWTPCTSTCCTTC